MLRLHARNPILLTVAAAIIVVALFAMLAPRVAPTRNSPPEVTEYEHTMVGSRFFGAAPAPTPAPTSKPMDTSLAVAQIARTGSIDVLVGNVDSSVNRIGELARAAGGDVFGLDAQSAGDGSGSQSATVTVRIAATRFDAMMAQLAALGTVRSRSVRAEDLSANITDSSARLRNLKRTEADMLKIMDRSGRVGEILDVENQLSSVREQIETLQADVASMRGRVTYSTIDIRLEAAVKSAPAEPGAITQLKNALAGATHSLVDTTIALAGICIWIAVYVPYIVAAVLGVWLIRRVYMRARRS